MLVYTTNACCFLQKQAYLLINKQKKTCSGKCINTHRDVEVLQSANSVSHTPMHTRTHTHTHTHTHRQYNWLYKQGFDDSPQTIGSRAA